MRLVQLNDWKGITMTVKNKILRANFPIMVNEEMLSGLNDGEAEEIISKLITMLTTDVKYQKLVNDIELAYLNQDMNSYMHLIELAVAYGESGIARILAEEGFDVPKKVYGPGEDPWGSMAH